MQIYELSSNKEINIKQKHWYQAHESYFIICTSHEILNLQPTFHFDRSTIEECVNIDENVRFESFEGYDFISLTYFIYANRKISFEEINLYIGVNFIILVSPNPQFENNEFIDFLKSKFNATTEKFLPRVYFFIFDKILADLFATLEVIEDDIQMFRNELITQFKDRSILEINEFHHIIYKIKKQLRPLLYIGDQFAVNENNFIPKDKLRYFKNIDVRINKLYDFSVNLMDMVEQLNYLYDSNLTMKTNTVITKLTIITMLFGPPTVIAGIYGMNFEAMPELHFKYGYPMALLLMAVITYIIYILVKKKKIM